MCHHFPSLGLGVKSGKCQIRRRDASFPSLRFWRRLLFRGFMSIWGTPIQIRELLGHSQEASSFNLDTKPLLVACREPRGSSSCLLLVGAGCPTADIEIDWL